MPDTTNSSQYNLKLWLSYKLQYSTITVQQCTCTQLRLTHTSSSRVTSAGLDSRFSAFDPDFSSVPASVGCWRAGSDQLSLCSTFSRLGSTKFTHWHSSLRCTSHAHRLDGVRRVDVYHIYSWRTLSTPPSHLTIDWEHTIMALCI